MRWISSSKVCAAADDFIKIMVHDDGAICSERTGSTLFEKRFICLHCSVFIESELNRAVTY
jgi:hypothetical protein